MGEAFEVVNVAGHNHHLVDDGGRGDQGIGDGGRVGHMQRRGQPGHSGVDRKDLLLELMAHIVFEPGPKNCCGVGVAALGQQHAVFKFLDRDRRHVGLVGIDSAGPICHVRIGSPGVDLADLGDHVGVEQVHQSNITGHE